MTGWATMLALARRFWWAIPAAALAVALFATRATLAGRTAELAAEKAARREEIANLRATAAKAHADDLTHARAVETRQAQINQENQDALLSRLADARADADAYARQLRANRAAGADSGGGAGTDLPGATDAAGLSAHADRVAELDAQACAANTVIADGWQRWWRDVSGVER
jgi:hypothetical protein